MDGDYIQLYDLRGNVLDRLARLVDWSTQTWQHSRRYPVLMLDARTEVLYDFEHDGPGSACLAVADLDGDAARRRETAGRIYRALLTSTDWPLCWTSDEAPFMLACTDISRCANPAHSRHASAGLGSPSQPPRASSTIELTNGG